MPESTRHQRIAGRGRRRYARRYCRQRASRKPCVQRIAGRRPRRGQRLPHYANYEKLRGGDEADRQDAQQAVAEVISDPATPDDVGNASTADLNGGGFLRTDEVVARDTRA